MAKRAVTVLIPTYNRARFLPESLDSVLGQSVPPSQVIVINDGSTDNTREVLRPQMGRIGYLEKPNGGKSSALNLAMPLVRGDYLWILDDDDPAMPNALELHLKVLEADPVAGFTYSASYHGTTQPDEGRIKIAWLEPLESVPDDEIYPRLLESFFFHQSTMLVRTSCYRKVGPFDTQLLRSQDYEMILRIGRHFEGRRIGEPTICIRRHSGVRGPASNRFPADMSRSKWREYDRMIFNRLRKELELQEYLPRRLQLKPLGPAETRRAYLQRSTAMATHGLYAEMLEDLQLAVSQVGCDDRLSPSERGIVARGMTSLRPGERPLSDRSFMESVRSLCRGEAGRDIMTEMARGLYWRGKIALGSRQYRFFEQITRATWRLLRARGTCHAFLVKMKETLRVIDQEKANLPDAKPGMRRNGSGRGEESGRSQGTLE
jgi:glycosyltransferase involved in cell wall biosynthesis